MDDFQPELLDFTFLGFSLDLAVFIKAVRDFIETVDFFITAMEDTFIETLSDFFIEVFIDLDFLDLSEVFFIEFFIGETAGKDGFFDDFIDFFMLEIGYAAVFNYRRFKF